MTNDYQQWQVLVVGAGTMGHSIAQVFACKGFKVILTDENPAALELARSRIDNNLKTLCNFGEIDQETMQSAAERILFFSDYDRFAADSKIVVETVTEDIKVKQKVFSKLDKLCPQDTIFTSNTSALNIFEGISVSRPERLIIFHWCTPPHIFPLVELVKGPDTSNETLATCREIALLLDKKPAIVNQYMPGFIINRLSAAILREAGYMIAQGWTSPEDIDTAIANTFGLRFGFEGHMEVFDYIGWDIAYTVTKFLNPYLCSSPEPIELAREMVSKNTLGIKSGKGLKDYSGTTLEEADSIRQTKILKIKKVLDEINQAGL